MSTEFNAMQMINSQFPALTFQAKIDRPLQLFAAVQKLAEYAKKQLAEQNDKEVERCFTVAYDIMNHGSNLAKLAVQNVFVFSVSHWLEASFFVSQKSKSLFLKFFKNEYEAQIKRHLP